MGGGRNRRPGPGPSAHPANGGRAQLHRHLRAHGSLPAAVLPLHPRHGGGGRRDGRGRGRARSQSGPARGLCGPNRRLCRGTAHRGRPRGEAAGQDRRPDRGRDHAQGHDRAISLAANLQSRAGHDALVPCRGRRGRADRLPMGGVARRDRDRHRGLGGQGVDRAGAWLHLRHQLPRGRFRCRGEGL